MILSRFSQNVVIRTTEWDDATPEVGERRKQRPYWKMVYHGAAVMQVHAGSSSTWKTTNRILENDRINFVHLQERLQKVISDTEAGKTLRYTKNSACLPRVGTHFQVCYII